MMNFDLLATLIFLPVYLAVRWPYFRLPVGPDTGYYVSNHTIACRKFSFSKGWNARYAMCSKILPEAFLSLLYLKYGHRRYPFAWRLAFSLYNYLTAVGVGLLAGAVTNWHPYSYVAGLVSYGLVSSEPHYGIYYESSEQFEILFQVMGTYLVILGVGTARPGVALAGVALWLFDAAFIKITGIVAAAPVVLGAAILDPGLWKYILLEGVIALGTYLGLFITFNRNPLAVIRTELCHQSYYSRFGVGDVKVSEGLAVQLVKKLKLIRRITGGNPAIPLLAFLGLAWVLAGRLEGEGEIFLYLFLLGVLLKLCVSFLPMWWYQVPLLPPIALFCSFGCLALIGLGFKGVALILVFLAAWLYVNVYRVRRMDLSELNRHTWKIHSDMGILHFEMQELSPELERIVGNRSLFVYGLPSPNAMVGQSYDVNFLTAAYYMDEMNPEWNIELHKKMVQEPPAFILSMLHGFDAQAVRENLGLKYERIKTWPGKIWDCHLYAHVNQTPVEHPNYAFRSLIV